MNYLRQFVVAYGQTSAGPLGAVLVNAIRQGNGLPVRGSGTPPPPLPALAANPQASMASVVNRGEAVGATPGAAAGASTTGAKLLGTSGAGGTQTLGG